MQVYPTDGNGVWTGEVRTVLPKGGWKRKEITTSPPTLSDGQYAQWRGRSWEVFDEYPVDPVKESMRANVAALRYDRENGGASFNETNIQTDRQSQSTITSAALAAQMDDTITIRWKTADGIFIELNASQIIEMAQGVRAHVQACFDREAELLDAINAAETVEELEAIDINAGWPE